MMQKLKILLPTSSYLLEISQVLQAPFYALTELLSYLNTCTLSNTEQ